MKKNELTEEAYVSPVTAIYLAETSSIVCGSNGGTEETEYDPWKY